VKRSLAKTQRRKNEGVTIKVLKKSNFDLFQENAETTGEKKKKLEGQGDVRRDGGQEKEARRNRTGRFKTFEGEACPRRGYFGHGRDTKGASRKNRQ